MSPPDTLRRAVGIPFAIRSGRALAQALLDARVASMGWR
jgi:hypothetical protein